jgi:putative heme-binding domain-containing protein
MKVAVLVPSAIPFLIAASLPGLAIGASPKSSTNGHLGRGEAVFRVNCAPCHGQRGEGGQGPPLAVPRLARVTSPEALLKVIKSGIEGTEMPGARLDPEEVRQVAAWVTRLGQRPIEKVAGTAAVGEQLYYGKGACASCHTIRGRGGALGPDLTDIGLRRGASHLRASIVRPDEAIPRGNSLYRSDVSISQNFLQVRLVTKGGQEIRGARLNEDTFSIQVRDGSNAVYSFFKAELAELHKEWGRSPMPTYEGALSSTELDDIVAFLVSLRGDGSR